MVGKEGEELHIAVLPWLAFGHIIPFFHLSKSLAGAGHRRKIKVSFLSTPNNLRRLPPIPPHLSSYLQLVSLPLPTTVYGLPAGAEATSDINPDQNNLLKLAADQLAGPLTSFIDVATPELIIYDFFHHWLPPLAHTRGVRTIFLSIFLASTVALFGPSAPGGEFPTWPSSPVDLTSPAPWVTFPTHITFRRHEAELLFPAFNHPNPTGISNVHRFRSAVAGADAILIRTCTEFEPEFLPLLFHLHNKPVLPVGLLHPDPPPAAAEISHELEWLDKQPPRSTVYVAFGSEWVLRPEQVTEMAMGLEMSSVPFIWAHRDKQPRLPAGFEERVKGRGLVCRGWVAQPLIVGHEAVGGFLTHCGLSSIIESVGQGKPFVGLPIAFDHGLICRSMVEMGIGMEVDRDEVSGSFTREDVARVVRHVLVDEDGGPIRAKALEMKDMFLSEEWNQVYVDKLINFLEKLGQHVEK